MEVLERSVYLGPSLYARFPVIRLLLDLGELEEWPTGRLGPRFNDALLEALPGLQAHGCSYGEPGGFVRRLTEDEGTWLGHVLEHVAIELQNVAGGQVTFGKTRSAGAPGRYDVVYEYLERRVGLEASQLALNLLHSLLPEELQPAGSIPQDFEFATERDLFIRYVQKHALGPSTESLVRAAQERDIPTLRLNEYSLVQFGHGRYQQRIQATVTSRTPHIAVEIASDKEETNRILEDIGLPVPKQRLVYNETAAARAAEVIGYPVVVKPLNANHGRGVSLNLTENEQVRTAYGQAREHSRGVIVESFITGLDHRMLVVDGELIAVAKRVPGHVVGDGEHTIEELVEELNKDPRRGIGHEKVLTQIRFDHQANRVLALQGYDRNSVPVKDEVVHLRSTGNLSTGGTAVDLTDVVHPDNREMAIRAAKAIGLDVAGVDFLTMDITRSYKETGAAICEVNAAPGFRMHVQPSEGQPRDVAGPVMDMLFPPGSPSRIPVHAVTGTNGKTTTARMLAHIHKLSGMTVGLATTDGVYIDGQLTVEGDMTGPIAARMVLRDPLVEVAVLETARGGLLRAGMGYRKCNTAACLNVKADHLGLRGIETLEELAEVKRIPIEVATDTVVLNADDPLCLQMADYATADHVCYATMNPSHKLVREHIRAGGRAVALEQGINGHMITLYDGGSHIPLLWTHLIPATMEGRALFNVQNAMFAAAMAYSLGVKLEDIRHGLRTFDTTFFQAPGRLNVYDEHPFKVILDYAHNPDAVDSICRLVETLDAKGRKIVVISAPGDRRDEDIRAMAAHAAGVFDYYICRRDDSLRGRESDAVPGILRDALIEGGVAADRIQVIPDEQNAVSEALRMAAADDLLIIFGDAISRTWKQIINFASDAETPRTEVTSAAPVQLPDVPELALDDDQALVRDERGVRIARQLED
jgi:cyanophycin synthetase